MQFINNLISCVVAIIICYSYYNWYKGCYIIQNQSALKFDKIYVSFNITNSSGKPVTTQQIINIRLLF